MKKLFYFMILLAYGSISAQQYIIGKVTTEIDTQAPGVIVYNLRSEEMVQTDKDGHFIIKAIATDELRFIKRNFDRVSVIVKPEDFTKPLNISIQLSPQMIEEVELTFRPTGNLKKDVRALNPPKKVEELNRSIANSLMTPPEKSYPSNTMPSTITMGPNFSAGQVPLLTIGNGNGGILGGLARAITKKIGQDKTTPDFIERQNFYVKVKESVDLDFFYKHGLDEYQFEMLLVYTDNKYDLAKNFRANFNKVAIENYLKAELKEFMDSKIRPSQKPS